MSSRLPTIENILELPALFTGPIPEEWEDQNGHVNIQYYMVLYDKGGRPLMQSMGFNDSYFSERRCGLFDLEHHLRYLAELYVGETVSVHARLLNKNLKRFHGMMFLVNQTRQQLAGTMEFVSSSADLDTRRTNAFPDDIAKVLEDIIGEHARLDWQAPVCGVISV